MPRIGIKNSSPEWPGIINTIYAHWQMQLSNPQNQPSVVPHLSQIKTSAMKKKIGFASPNSISGLLFASQCMVFLQRAENSRSWFLCHRRKSHSEGSRVSPWAFWNDEFRGAGKNQMVESPRDSKSNNSGLCETKLGTRKHLLCILPNPVLNY